MTFALACVGSSASSLCLRLGGPGRRHYSGLELLRGTAPTQRVEGRVSDDRIPILTAVLVERLEDPVFPFVGRGDSVLVRGGLVYGGFARGVGAGVEHVALNRQA